MSVGRVQAILFKEYSFIISPDFLYQEKVYNYS